MGTCTSTARHRQKKLHQYNRTSLKNPIVLDIKSPPPLPPLPTFPNYRFQHPHTLFPDFDILSTPLTKPVFHQTDTNSLIHLYSSNTNNNNNNNNSNILHWMSSSSAATHVPPRIPVLKTRLPVYHPPQQPSTSVRPTNVISTVISNNHTGNREVKNIVSYIFIGQSYPFFLYACVINTTDILWGLQRWICIMSPISLILLLHFLVLSKCWSTHILQ